MKTIKNFFKGLFNETGCVSSKRVSGIICIICCAVAFMANQFMHLQVDHELFNAFLIFTATCFGMNLAAQLKTIDAKKDVAIDAAKNTNDEVPAT